MMDKHNEYTYFRFIQSKAVNAVSIESKNAIDYKQSCVIQIQWNESKHLFSIYEKPVYIVEDRLGKLLEQFQKGMNKTPIALADTNAQFMALYWIFQFETINCNAQKPQLMIPQKEVGCKYIFKVKKGIMEYLVMHKNLAEEILKARFSDIELEGVNTYD